MSLYDAPGGTLDDVRRVGVPIAVRRAGLDIGKYLIEGDIAQAGEAVGRRPRLYRLHLIAVRIGLLAVADIDANQPEPLRFAHRRRYVHLGAVHADQASPIDLAQSECLALFR